MSNLPEIHCSFELSRCDDVTFSGLSFKRGANFTAYETQVNINQCKVQDTDTTFTFIQSSVTFDSVIFANLSLANQILALRSDDLIIKNCRFHSIFLDIDIGKIFIDVESVRNVSMKNIIFAHNSGLSQPKLYENSISEILPYFRITKSKSFTIEDVTLRENSYSYFDVKVTPEVNGHGLNILHNVNTTLKFQNIHGNVSEVLMETRRLRGDEGPILSFKKSRVQLQVYSFISFY